MDRSHRYILFPPDLDYPGVGPEHAHLYDIGRAEYVPVTDDEAVDAFEYLSRTEGIIPAIESAHAVAYARKIVPHDEQRSDCCNHYFRTWRQGLCGNRTLQRGGYP